MDVVNNICQFLSASTNHTFMILWAIGVLFFIIMEFMTFGLTHIWYAFGCIFAGIAAYNDVSIFLQLVIFIVSSTVLVLLTRPIAEKHVNGKTKKTKYTQENCDYFMTEHKGKFYIFPIFGTTETRFWTVPIKSSTCKIAKNFLNFC